MGRLSRRRFVAVAAAGAVTAWGASACGDSQPSTRSGSKSKEFTLWSFWSEGEPNQLVLAEAIKDFTSATGVRVKPQWKGRNAMQALLPALNTQNVPADIIEGNGSQLTTIFAPTGQAMDLAEVYAAKVPGESGTVADVVGAAYKGIGTSDDGVLAMVPYQVSTYAWFYDGKAFPELASQPPQTWEDFTALLDEQKAKKRRPVAQDGSVPGYNAYYIQHFARALAGDEAWVAAFTDRTGEAWRGAEFRKAAEHVERFAKADYFLAGFNASKFPAMQQKWAAGESDFLFGGTWLPRETQPYAKKGFEYVSFPFPSVEGKQPTLNVATFGFGIPKKAKNAEPAKEFIAFFLQKKYQDKIASVAKEMSVRTDVKAAPIVALAKQSLDSGHVNRARTPPEFSDFSAKVLSPLNDRLLFGTITAEEFSTGMVTAAAKFWKARR
ncbi:ABC transporter substrate-binding protein [Actinopolymorpha alba]|uniref:ABC transporter substrate-binding protein n=1 Tax=Actinopolymorpha alba TaxID=533267 RepID=UPI00037E172C|nr:ABC transporter substrate-binding protein [Actinopolymorpha alba]